MKRLLFALSLLFPLFVMAQGAPPGEDEFEKGKKYFHGYYGAKVDYSKALKWYRKAAEKGHTAAQCQLGVMYENGNGVAKDLDEAEKWYKKALEEDPFDENVQKLLSNLQKKKTELQKFASKNNAPQTELKPQPKSQEMIVKSLTALTTDLSAGLSEYERKDNVGKACALLKIQMTDELERVEGNYIGNIVKRGLETWVYLTDGSKEVKLYPKAHLPLSIYFNDYGVKSLKSKSTYLLILIEDL